MVNIITKQELMQEFNGDKTNMESNKINYEDESKKLQEATNRPEFWNPKEGKYEITILSELETYSYIDKETQQQQDRAKVSIQEKDKEEELVWGFGIGKTRASTYGQLVEIAKKNGNTLLGKSVTVVIKSDGKKRDFTIV